MPSRLKTWLLVFAVATALVGLTGKALWDVDWGPEPNLRRLCRKLDLPLPEEGDGMAALRRVCDRWKLPIPKTIEDLDVAYGDADDGEKRVWMRVRVRIPPEEMADWMFEARQGLGTMPTPTDPEIRKEAADYGCDGGSECLIPWPGYRKFGDAAVYAESEAGKIDIVWIR